MKKVTLFLVATLFSALSFAALNPYAYGLKSKLSDDEKTVTITYKLNAPATAVSVVVLDGETVLKTQASTGISQGEHNVVVSTDGFPKGKTLKWKVVVNGTLVGSPTIQDKSYAFYMPSSIAVDTDTESDYFGRWYAIEATRKNANQTHSGYHTYEPNKNVRALYAFEATLDPIANASGTYGFTGGWNWGATETNVNGDYLNLWRVTTSGGRVFIGKYREGQTAVVEVNPADLSANFTDVIPAGKRVVSITATGRGEDLKLVILDTDLNITEYDLGVASSVTSATLSRTYTQKVGSNKLTVRNDATITYDNVGGGIWLNQNREGTDLPTIAHITPGGVDYDNLSADVSHVFCRNSGIAMSPDGSELAVVGAGAKKLTIYSVSKDAAGKISLTRKYDPISTAGSNHTALSYDYAGNLYVANRSVETITFYAMPYSGTVETPCPSTQTFSLKADPQLNPFAYNLTSELSADEKNLTINYSLNAKATSVNWVLMDGNSVVKTIDLASLGLEKDNYTTTISTADFPTFKQLTWKIEVKGVAVNEPTHVKAVNFYRPFGVDIDNNPENKYFGRIICGETSTHGKSGYVSSGLGAGIYAYDAGFEALPNGTKPGYNGGKTFTEHSPYRVRISEDGRIFVTAHDKAGDFLWEVNPENLNEWTSVFKGASHNADKLLDASGEFIAGTNAGFDVRGKGENLQLLMLSCNNLGTSTATFQCHEYNLGNATEWSTVPTRSISGTQLHSSMIARYSQVTYDNEGGFWCTYYINGTIWGGIAHFTKEGTKDHEIHGIPVRAAGMCFNRDFSKVLIAGNDIYGTTKETAKAVVYTISKDAAGKPVLTKETIIDMATVGGNLNDFA